MGKKPKNTLLLEFLANRNLRSSTRKSYRYHLQKYERFMKKSLELLLREAEEEEDRGVRLRKRKIKKYLTNYRDYLETENFSPSYISLSMRIIKTFYIEYDIQLPNVPSQTKVKKISNNINSLPTTDDIQKAVSYSSIQLKAIILLMVSSGMGSSEVRNLKYKDFLEAIKNSLESPINNPLDIGEIGNLLAKKDIVPEWNIRRQKTQNYYFTFSSPESTKAILNYLEDNPPYMLSDYLFRSRNNKMSEHAFSVSFSRLNKKCKFGKAGPYIYFRSHNLRKIFTSILYSVGLPQLTIDWLLGHHIDPVTEAYFKADPSKLKNEYLKVLNSLTFTEKVKVKRIESEEFQELVKQLNDRDDRLKALEEVQKENNRKVKDFGWILEAVDNDEDLREALKESIRRGKAVPPQLRGND